MEIDRLSALPEHLLIDILGRLDDTKEAVKTDVLSKQWRFLWTDLPSITLKNFCYEGDEIQRFAAGVHAVAARTKPPLQKLTVHLHYDKRFATDVDACLESAAKSEVKHLDLCLRPIHDPPRVNSNLYTLPQAIYSHSPLTTLDMKYCNVAPPPAAAVEWRSMTDLSIYCTELTQRAKDGITSGCPVLRRLKLFWCTGFDRLEIRGRSFRYLKVFGCFDHSRDVDEEQLFEISAPYMRDLNLILLDPQRVNVRLTDASSLEKARIEFHHARVWAPNAGPFSDEEMLTNTKELFEEIRRVRSLALGPDWLKVLSMMREKGRKFPQSRVEELEINHSPNEENVYTVLAILESSPRLEELMISNFICSKECMKWDPTLRTDLNGDLSRLKNVRIKITVNPKFCGELSFTLAQILLKRAPILEKMSIQIRSLTYRPVSDELVQKFETLLTYPRSSQKAAVEIHL